MNRGREGRRGKKLEYKGCTMELQLLGCNSNLIICKLACLGHKFPVTFLLKATFGGE